MTTLEYRLYGVIPDVVFTHQPHFSCCFLSLICLLTNQNIQRIHSLLIRIEWTTGNGILISSSHWPIYNKFPPGAQRAFSSLKCLFRLFREVPMTNLTWHNVDATLLVPLGWQFCPRHTRGLCSHPSAHRWPQLPTLLSRCPETGNMLTTWLLFSHCLTWLPLSCENRHYLYKAPQLCTGEIWS